MNQLEPCKSSCEQVCGCLSLPVCLVFAGCEEDEADKASDIPFGSVGTVGMKRFAARH